MRRLIGPGSLIQGSIPEPGPRGRLFVPRLEALVLDSGPEQSGVLVHYHRGQRRPDSPWQRGETVCSDAAGPGLIAEVPGVRGRPGELHALVPVIAADGTRAVAHWSRPSTPEDCSWTGLGAVPGTVAGLGVAGGRLVASVAGSQGLRVLRWTGTAWVEDPRCPHPVVLGAEAGLPEDAVAMAVVDTALGGAGPSREFLAGLPGGDRGVRTGSVRRGWRQALVQEGASVHLWHRQTWRGRVRWMRASCLRFDPGQVSTADPRPSFKVAQVTGEIDTQPCSEGATLSTSRSRSGVRGTDLGVTVEHEGESFLLFGDTHWTRPLWATLDAIAAVRPAEQPGGLPEVEVHGSPLRARGRRVTAREYDVPLDAFSDGGRLFAFFSSNHFVRHQVMGRSVVTRSRSARLRIDGRQPRRPIVFDVLGTFSDRYFVNVSVVRRGDQLFLWGSGAYRADDLRLAVLDLVAEPVRAALAGRTRWQRPLAGLSYWSGMAGGRPLWSADEEDAAALLPGAYGELSVRWVPEVERYLLLAMTGPEDPLGAAVTLRWARDPWGPWSPRRRLFDWIAEGVHPGDETTRFIRSRPVDDPVGDAIFGVQARMTGGAYAPYLFDSRLEGGTLVIRYTLSTWNPYQVVLMEHRLDAAALV